MFINCFSYTFTSGLTLASGNCKPFLFYSGANKPIQYTFTDTQTRTLKDRQTHSYTF